MNGMNFINSFVHDCTLFSICVIHGENLFINRSVSHLKVDNLSKLRRFKTCSSCLVEGTREVSLLLFSDLIFRNNLGQISCLLFSKRGMLLTDKASLSYIEIKIKNANSKHAFSFMHTPF